MGKIRINELARQLEVPSHEILEVLPKLGFTEKKTHSSSVDDHVAEQVRLALVGDGARPARGAAESNGKSALTASKDESEETPSKVVEAEPDESPTPAAAAEPPAPQVRRAPEAMGEEPSLAAVAAPVEKPVEAAQAQPQEPVRSKPAPIRPPLAGQSTGLRPPFTPVAREPYSPTPRNAPIPARPEPPAPRPGQILSGPRQPLPGASVPAQPRVVPAPPTGSLSSPATPAAPTQASPGSPAAVRPSPSVVTGPPSGVITPGAPRPPAPMPGTPARPVPRPAPPTHSIAPGPSGPSAPSPNVPLRAQVRPGLAGQPSVRPVVPPNPAMLARLQQAKTPTPGAPPPPRPGMPTQRTQTALPGQPIYRGPIRPGQPVMRGPGAPTPGSPGGPGGLAPRGLRTRPMHPTSPLRMEPQAPPPTDPQRRHQAKPSGPRDRHRDLDKEEGRLRQPMRRDQPAAPPPIDREITVADGITVKELSEKLGVKANLVIKKLVEKRIFATINQTLDTKMAEGLARDFGASTNKVSFEEEETQVAELAEEPKDQLKRAPVVTIMGHVDHGKTSLLDSIRSARVAEREAGGITQHIGAYRIEKNGRKIVFIDTPGHEAFTRMRARGAKVTDIVILVVAADDGVMPQTLEAIDHAKAAKVPIIVAINKVDKGDAQPERIKQQLSDRGLVPEDWGGDTVMVPVSARAKTNLDLLLEMILLVADLQDLKANPDRPAVGTVLEAKLDRGRGPVATVLVRNGTLRVGDQFICGSVFSKVRAMYDDQGAPVREAEPSMPVEVLGLDSLPEVGDTFQVVTDTAKAKQIVVYREAKARDVAMAKNSRITLEQFHQQLKEGEVKELNIILKTDVGGTAEVLSDMMQKLSDERVRVRIIRSGVGAITEGDVLLAATSDAIVIGFNVRPERDATAAAEHEKVDIRLHTIIYELTDEIKKAMTGLLSPVFKEVYQGRAEVREVFKITKVGNVAGSYVLDGFLKRDSQIRILRDNAVVHTGRVDSIKRFKNDVGEVKTGFECGITIANYSDLKAGDIIEAFVTERVAVEAVV